MYYSSKIFGQKIEIFQICTILVGMEQYKIGYDNPNHISVTYSSSLIEIYFNKNYAA